jgi:NADP-dependent 3-hydroxy acid dehydrogenase YdfG
MICKALFVIVIYLALFICPSLSSTILITGGMGMVGKHVVIELLALGHHVISIDIRNQTSDLLNLCQVENVLENVLENYTFLQNDIRSSSTTCTYVMLLFNSLNAFSLYVGIFPCGGN